MAPLTGTPVAPHVNLIITAPVVLNGTYGDFTFENSNESCLITQHGESALLLDAPPGEYNARFLYEMAFDTKFTLTDNGSAVVDDKDRGTVEKVQCIYELKDLSLAQMDNETVNVDGLGYGTGSFLRPDFPNQDDIKSIERMIKDLQFCFHVSKSQLYAEIVGGPGGYAELHCRGKLNGKKFVNVEYSHKFNQNTRYCSVINFNDMSGVDTDDQLPLGDGDAPPDVDWD